MVRTTFIAFLTALLFLLCATKVRAQDEGKKYYDKAESLSGRYKKSVSLLEKSSDLGYLPANNRLFFYFSNGVYNSFLKDEAKAFNYIMRSAVAGDTTGILTVAKCYKEGDCVQKNIYSAVEWYEKAAPKCSTTAMFQLAEIYKMPNEPLHNSEKADEWNAKAAQGGDKEALLKVLLQKKDCDGLWELSQVYNRIHVYYLSSEIGCAKCSYQLYVYYDHRQGGAYDALSYLELAKKQGYAVKDRELMDAQQMIDRIPARPLGYKDPPVNSNTTTSNQRGAERKCPYCHGEGQIKSEGVKSTTTNNFGQTYNTYQAAHWTSCSYCKGTGYIKE